MFQKFTIKIKLIVTSSKNNNPHYYTIIITCVLPMLCSVAHGLMQLPCWPLLVLDCPPQIDSLCTRLTGYSSLTKSIGLWYATRRLFFYLSAFGAAIQFTKEAHILQDLPVLKCTSTDLLHYLHIHCYIIYIFTYVHTYVHRRRLVINIGGQKVWVTNIGGAKFWKNIFS